MRSWARRHRAASALTATRNVAAFALLSSRLSRAAATSSEACATLGFHDCAVADCELLRARAADDRMYDECVSCCASSSSSTALYASARVRMCK